MRFVPFKIFYLGGYLAYVGLVHLWTDQRIPGPVSCRCPSGLLETPPRWHATIYMSSKVKLIGQGHQVTIKGDFQSFRWVDRCLFDRVGDPQ